MTDPVPVLVGVDQLDDLRRLLGIVEDWLLHAGDEALDDLGGFLAEQAWSAGPPQRLTGALIADLGEHTVLLRRALTRAPRTADHSTADHSTADHSTAGCSCGQPS